MRYVLLMLLLVSFQGYGDVYKCVNDSGDISYQANPCQVHDNTIAFTPQKIETKYKSINDVINREEHQSNGTKRQAPSCPFIPSYELRNLRVKNDYIRGMKKQDIRQRLGQPTSMKKNKWTYLGNHVNRTFQFKNGCLTAWREKWKGKESQISKYRN